MLPTAPLMVEKKSTKTKTYRLGRKCPAFSSND
jgi:hypothetical protein